jgi:hypothetical protein
MIRRDGLAFPAAAHRRSAYYTSPSGEHHLPLLSTEFSFVGHSVARTKQHSSARSFVLAYDPTRWPCSPHDSALALSSLQSYLRATTTCLSFTRSPAHSQTLLEGLSTLPRPPRRSPSCDTAKTPIFRQHTGAQYPQLPPLRGNHYWPPSNRIQLCSLALNTAPQTPPSLRPRSPQILLSLGLRVEGPLITFCYNWSRPSDTPGT